MIYQHQFCGDSRDPWLRYSEGISLPPPPQIRGHGIFLQEWEGLMSNKDK